MARGTVDKLCDILVACGTNISIAMLTPVLIETLTALCAFAPARRVVREREDTVVALHAMSGVPAARRLGVRIGASLTPLGAPPGSPRASASGGVPSSTAATAAAAAAGGFRGARAPSPPGRADAELVRASRGDPTRRAKIVQLLALNLTQSAVVAATALDTASGNVDVAAAHLIEHPGAPATPPPSAAPASGSAQTDMITIRVTVPPNFRAGQMLRATTPDGSTHEITVPQYAGPGESFQVTVPSRKAPTSREVSVQVPLSWVPGTALMVSGPDGQTLRIQPPPTTRPGDSIRVRYPSS